MKKLLLLSTVLLGAAGVSQAGVRFNLGFGIPLPPPPVMVTPPAPVYVQPPVPTCVTPPVYVTPPAVVAPPVPGFGYGDLGRGHFYGQYRHDFRGSQHYRR